MSTQEPSRTITPEMRRELVAAWDDAVSAWREFVEPAEDDLPSGAADREIETSQWLRDCSQGIRGEGVGLYSPGRVADGGVA